MSKPTGKALVPALRFPEFRDAGEWNEQKLEEVASFSKGKGISKSDVVADGKQPCIRYGELYTLYKETIENVSSHTNLSVNDLVLSKANDVIIPASGETKEDIATASCVIKSDIALGGDLNIIRSEMNGVFLSYYLNSAKKKSISQLAQGISVVHLYSSQLKNIDLNIPGPPEQQKIADCLSSIDELITAHTQKYEALKTHKKGLMQQLFPATGETAPKLRFPEFRDTGEWEGRPLKKVFSIFQGFAFSSKDSVKAGVRWLKIADVSIQYMNHKTPSYLPVEHKDKHEKFSVKQGDYVIALTRPILSKQLKMARVDKVYDEALLNQRVGKLVTTQNISFIYFLLQTSKVINDIEISISGSEPPNLSAQQIEDIKTNIPSKKEQQKIADCLYSLDNLITTQAQKIESLKAHKKGLMQQLFPAADGVKG